MESGFAGTPEGPRRVRRLDGAFLFGQLDVRQYSTSNCRLAGDSLRIRWELAYLPS
jgi:hypothetical protein